MLEAAVNCCPKRIETKKTTKSIEAEIQAIELQIKQSEKL